MFWQRLYDLIWEMQRQQDCSEPDTVGLEATLKMPPSEQSRDFTRFIKEVFKRGS